jgi:hypothetical protein
MSKEKKLVNVHKFKYSEVKADLQGYFNKFMADPKAFGVEDEKVVKELQNMGGLKKHFMWKKFKEVFNLKMEDLASKEAASAFIIDFEQDKDHQLLTLKQLNKILDDPANSEFALEKDTIEYIKSKKFDKKAFIKQVTDIDQDLKSESKQDLSEGHGQKILNFLKSLWAKVSPLFDKIFDSLMNVGEKALKKVVDEKVPEEFKEITKIAIDSGKVVVGETKNSVNELIISDNKGDDKKEEKIPLSGEVTEEVAHS